MSSVTNDIHNINDVNDINNKTSFVINQMAYSFGNKSSKSEAVVQQKLVINLMYTVSWNMPKCNVKPHYHPIG